MDSVTQFLLGAVVATSLLGERLQAPPNKSNPEHDPKALGNVAQEDTLAVPQQLQLGAKAILLGGLVATLPDLDSFLPYGNVIDNVTYHRGFSHSLIVQTLITPLLAVGLCKLFTSLKPHIKQLILTIWLCLITHSLLDSLTTYGTQLFWPLNQVTTMVMGAAPDISSLFAFPPAAFPSVFIIDPLYSSLLLIGLVLYLVFRRNSQRAMKLVRTFLALSTCYLLLGMGSHFLVLQRAAATPELAGKRIHVQPVPFTILYWQVLGIDEKNYYTGVTSLMHSCPTIDLTPYQRQAAPPEGSHPSQSVKRLEWFTNGFYSYDQIGSKQVIRDLRIGFAPFFPFSFQFGEKVTDGNDWVIKSLKPRRIRQARPDDYLDRIYGAGARMPNAC